MPPKFQHRARNDVFQAILQLEAAYLEIHDPSQENYTHSEQRVFTSAYVNTHIQQPHYSSTPLPSPSSSHSSQHIENQHCNNPLAPIPNNSFYAQMITTLEAPVIIHLLHSPPRCLLRYLPKPLLLVIFVILWKIVEYRIMIV
ncbi:unnamed protein product [Diabrotica balteata]|uniref:Uncharacterized protein n=1 Tax=Diabrotica balteata TaxID=107213 RepID=A0A9N9T596_DIABA|nr:unnamed protein product [Diabrotica balteata]